MKQLVISLAIVFLASSNFAQKLELFKVSNSTSHYKYAYGLRNASNQEIIINAQYDYLYFIADSSFLQVQNNGLKGIFDMNGNLVLPIIYQEILSIDGVIFKVQQNGKWGLLDSKAHVLTPLEYDWIMYENDNLRLVRKAGKFGLIDLSNNVVADIVYDEIYKNGDYFVVVYKGGFGLLDRNGLVHLEPIYSFIKGFMGDYFLVENLKMFAIYAAKGAIVPDFIYDFVGEPYKGLAAVSIDNKNGVLNEKSEIIVPLLYDKPINVRSNVLQVESNGYIGYYSREGKKLCDIKYINETVFSNGWLILQSHNSKALIDLSGQIETSFEYEEISVIDREKAVVKEADKVWTVRNIATNTRVNNTVYLYISHFKNGVGFAKNQLGKCFLVNKQLEQLSPAVYSYIFIQKSYAEVWIGDKKGVITLKGKEIIPVKYKNITCTNGYFSCVTNRIEDLYNTRGRKIFDKSYKFVINLNNGVFVVYHHRKWGVLDSNNRQVLPFYFNQINYLNHNLLAGLHKGTWQVMDLSGQVLFVVEADYVNVLNENLFLVKKDNLFGLIDALGTTILPIVFNEVKPNECGGIMVRLHNKWGIYSHKGIIILPVEFDKIETYYGPFAKVQKAGKWAHINSMCQLMYVPKYDEVENFTNNCATVTLNGKQTLINEKGEELLPFVYDQVFYRRTNEQLYDISLNEKWGLMSSAKKVIIEPKYSAIGQFDRNGLAIVLQKEAGENTYGVLSKDGKEIILPVYDEISFYHLKILAKKSGNTYIFNQDGVCENCGIE